MVKGQAKGLAFLIIGISACCRPAAEKPSIPLCSDPGDTLTQGKGIFMLRFPFSHPSGKALPHYITEIRSEASYPNNPIERPYRAMQHDSSTCTNQCCITIFLVLL